MNITHEEYFRNYKLSAEQYGEILVSIAFGGTKMPDNNKGYDIGAAVIDGKDARIEVKSKRAQGASVVHCGRNKFGRGSKGMTHLAVVLVDQNKENKHSVTEAWLVSQQQARTLKRRKTKSKYINVSEMRAKAESGEITTITERLRRAAKRVA